MGFASMQRRTSMTLIIRTNTFAAMTRAAREAAGHRNIFIVAENEPQDVQMVKPWAEGGFGMDAMWNDDFHHTAMVALIGRNEAYYTDYRGSAQEFVSVAKYGSSTRGSGTDGRNNHAARRCGCILSIWYCSFKTTIKSPIPDWANGSTNWRARHSVGR